MKKKEWWHLDAKILYEIIRRLPDNNVTIQTDDKLTATITCEKAKFTIPGKSGEDFAYLPIIEKEEALTVSQFTLKEMIRQTIFSIASNETNKLMTGELFEIKDNCPESGISGRTSYCNQTYGTEEGLC